MILILILASSTLTAAKIYGRCGLARELKYVHKAPSHQIATWVCIAEHESGYNTSIVGYLSGDGSADHGLFQISDRYWCSPPNKGFACGVTCAQLEDDDISDDFICAQQIYKEHKELTGDGFNAWAVYKPHCKGHKADRYIKDCFNDFEEPKERTPSPPSVFAHGFFDTGAGKTTKFSLPFEKSHPYFTPTSSFLTSEIFSAPTEKSTFNSFVPARSPFSNVFSTTISTPFSSFFTPKTNSIYSNAVSATNSPRGNNPIVFHDPTTNTLPSSSQIFFTPSTSTSSSIFSANRRSLTVGSNPIPASSSSSLLDPTTSTTVYQTNRILNEPIFIVNGVKWY